MKITAMLAAVGLAAVVLAASPSAAGQGSISLDQSAPAFGDTVTFTIDSGNVDYPWVRVTCYQDGALVYGHTLGYFDGALGDQSFLLGPTGLWEGGAAACDAGLLVIKGTKDRTLASASFDVTG